MKNNKGYTVIELLIIIALVGVGAFIAINKASYAFPSTSSTNMLLETEENLVKKAATSYAENNKDIFKESNTSFIRVEDLADAGYLPTNAEGKVDLSFIKESLKIKMGLKDDKVKVTLEK